MNNASYARLQYSPMIQKDYHVLQKIAKFCTPFWTPWSRQLSKDFKMSVDKLGFYQNPTNTLKYAREIVTLFYGKTKIFLFSYFLNEPFLNEPMNH
jgi:hypothetical protein